MVHCTRLVTLDASALRVLSSSSVYLFRSHYKKTPCQINFLFDAYWMAFYNRESQVQIIFMWNLKLQILFSRGTEAFSSERLRRFQFSHGLFIGCYSLRPVTSLWSSPLDPGQLLCCLELLLFLLHWFGDCRAVSLPYSHSSLWLQMLLHSNFFPFWTVLFQRCCLHCWWAWLCVPLGASWHCLHGTWGKLLSIFSQQTPYHPDFAAQTQSLPLCCPAMPMQPSPRAPGCHLRALLREAVGVRKVGNAVSPRQSQSQSGTHTAWL